MHQVSRLVGAENLIEYLNSRNKSDFQGDKIDRYLAQNRINWEDFVTHAHFREDTYGRNLVVKNECYELLVFTWLPNQGTPIHDHGGQRCWMYVQSGELTIKDYSIESLRCQELIGESEPVLKSAGQSAYVDDGIGIHSLENLSAKPAVSVHLYAGPIETCLIYNEETGRFESKKLDYFTEWGKLVAGG